VYRADLDGSNLEILASERYNLSMPQGLALDLSARKAYVTDWDYLGFGYILTFDMDSNVTNYHMLAATNYRQGKTNYTDPAAYYTVRKGAIIIIIIIIILTWTWTPT
jgi:hypothetical protein